MAEWPDMTDRQVGLDWLCRDARHDSKVIVGARHAVITVRNLPDEVHRALRIRAARHGRSTEAEVRDILEQAVLPGGGSSSERCSRKSGGKRAMSISACRATRRQPVR